MPICRFEAGAIYDATVFIVFVNVLSQYPNNHKRTLCSSNYYKGSTEAASTRTFSKMRFAFNILLLAFLAAFASATAPQKPVIVSYPNDTPQSVLEKAMDAIRNAVCFANPSNRSTDWLI